MNKRTFLVNLAPVLTLELGMVVASDDPNIALRRLPF